jgi:hypothetical protein
MINEMKVGSAKDPTKNPPKGTKAPATGKKNDNVDGAPGGFYPGAMKVIKDNPGSNGKKPAPKSPSGGAKKK